MCKADIVLGLIARSLGMEGRTAELRTLMDLYADAVQEDLYASGEDAPEPEPPQRDPPESVEDKPGGGPAWCASAPAITADAEEVELPEPGEVDEEMGTPPEPRSMPEAEVDQEEPGGVELPCPASSGSYSIRQGAHAAGEMGYTGFLHLRCRQCGEVKTFCAKTPLREYRCAACGAVTPLEGLTQARLNCECGNRSRYLTNRTEWGFDIPCVQCQAPVAVEYRSGANLYATIGKYAAKRRKGKRQ